MHPLSIQITTRDSVSQREVRRQYLLETRHPRWEMLRIFLDAFIHMRFR